MHEHIARAMYYFSVHLLYASVVGSAAWVLTSIRPRKRHHEILDLGCDGIQFRYPGRCIIDKLWAPHLTWAASARCHWRTGMGHDTRPQGGGACRNMDRRAP